ncbi:DUF5813 family protein [Salinirarus marinus]|uniref:DUF5813 family protein n=1 Tax=Salinirarus marinus TaxID=3068310 RepID=UPI003C6C83DB
MTEVHGRVRRAFADHESFERIADDCYELVTTPFDGRVEISPAEGGRHRFAVTVRVPTLGAVVEGDVAPVVEDGWYETFALRLEDVDGVMRRERDVTPDVEREGDDVIVEAAFEDVNERRAVDDAAALVDYVEGTYVQGVIPGYDYTDPVAGILSRAEETAGF